MTIVTFMIDIIKSPLLQIYTQPAVTCGAVTKTFSPKLHYLDLHKQGLCTTIPKKHRTPVHNSVNVWCNVSKFLCLLSVFVGLRPTAHFLENNLIDAFQKSTCKKGMFHSTNLRNEIGITTSWLIR